MQLESPTVPRIVIYCDESCYDLTGHQKFMAIGGLWVPREHKERLTRDFREFRQAVHLAGEVKWSKVSGQRLEDYKKLVDFFFAQHELRYRAIVVEQAKVKMEEYHGKDRELAFYKFYYEMLEKWLMAGNQYLILLDYKKNRQADRYTTLRTYLERYLRGKAWISDLTIIDSKETPLAQLCDLMTGAVAAAWNDIGQDTPKGRLIAYIAGKTGFRSLRVGTSLAEPKFNIFKMDL